MGASSPASGTAPIQFLHNSFTPHSNREFVMAGRMEGKKGVVVGAGQPEDELLGNGRAIALAFAREGAEVCAVDRDPERADATVEMIRKAGGKAHAVIADVGNVDDCARLIEESYAKLGRIDALVNNVAINHCDADALTLDVASWQLLMDINLRSMWLTSRAVVPFMRKHGGGAITNTSTIGSHTLSGRMFGYGISKAAVNALTHYFASQFAPDNIRCNAVLPGWVFTPHSIDGLTRHGVLPSREEYLKNGARFVPLNRMGFAQDVANAVLFLSSDEANFTTGLEVPVDGGTLQVRARYERRNG
jgi:NAD(P)-dependent dehydrogenase (short-subunit alcohol dehydrogenase family)